MLSIGRLLISICILVSATHAELAIADRAPVESEGKLVDQITTIDRTPAAEPADQISPEERVAR